MVLSLFLVVCFVLVFCSPKENLLEFRFDPSLLASFGLKNLNYQGGREHAYIETVKTPPLSECCCVEASSTEKGGRRLEACDAVSAYTSL